MRSHGFVRFCWTIGSRDLLASLTAILWAPASTKMPGVDLFYGLPCALNGILRDLRITWALEELQIRYLLERACRSDIDRSKSSDIFINTFGETGTGVARFFEAAAIVCHLYELAGRMPTAAAERAELNRWCFCILNAIEPTFFTLLLENRSWLTDSACAWRHADLRDVAHVRLTDLERVIKTRAYLVHDNFGPADILLTCSLDLAREQSAMFKDYAAVRAYLERCRARPAYRRALTVHTDASVSVDGDS
jgi:glutathione S-transferase